MNIYSNDFSLFLDISLGHRIGGLVGSAGMAYMAYHPGARGALPGRSLCDVKACGSGPKHRRGASKSIEELH